MRRSTLVLAALPALGCRQPPTSTAVANAMEDAGHTAAREELVRVPLAEHPGMTLECTIYRPAGKGPFPLVVLNHGASGKRDPNPRWRPTEHAAWFNGRGFIVAVPMRRGNAGSDGDWAEGYGSCEHADFARANTESAADIRSVLQFMRARSDVTANRVLLHGMSAGGLAALTLASTSPDGIVGVLDFAGGRASLSDDGGETRYNCSPKELVATAKRLGESSHLPTMWLYAQNDKYFPPPLAREMFDAFQSGSGNSEFVGLPPFGKDGHNVTWKPAGIALWAEPVDRFLTQIGFPKPR